MCQRCQKSLRLSARYGWSKFIGKRKPSSRAIPMAMSL